MTRYPIVIAHLRWVAPRDTLSALQRKELPAETALDPCHHDHYGALFETTEEAWRAGTEGRRCGRGRVT